MCVKLWVIMFELQVNNWTDWEIIQKFDNETDAKSYARETYAQNEWRIYDDINQRVTHQHDPSQVFSDIAMADLDRFQRVDNWTRRRQQRELRRTRLQRHATRQRLLVERQRYDFWDIYLKIETDKVNWIKEGF